MKRKTAETPYRSPYLLLAEYRAKERAKRANLRVKFQHLSKNAREWNSDVRSETLFDPHIKKVEIFKPKSATPQAMHPEAQFVEPHSLNYPQVSSSNDPMRPVSSQHKPLRVLECPTRRPLVYSHTTITRPHQFTSTPQTSSLNIHAGNSNSAEYVANADYQLTNIDQISQNTEATNGQTVTRSTSPIDERIVGLLLADNFSSSQYIHRYQPPYERSPDEYYPISKDILREVTRDTGTDNYNYGDSFIVDEMRPWQPLNSQNETLFQGQNDRTTNDFFNRQPNVETVSQNDDVLKQLVTYLRTRQYQQSNILNLTDSSAAVESSNAVLTSTARLLDAVGNIVCTVNQTNQTKLATIAATGDLSNNSNITLTETNSEDKRATTGEVISLPALLTGPLHEFDATVGGTSSPVPLTGSLQEHKVTVESAVLPTHTAMQRHEHISDQQVILPSSEPPPDPISVIEALTIEIERLRVLEAEARRLLNTPSKFLAGFSLNDRNHEGDNLSAAAGSVHHFENAMFSTTQEVVAQIEPTSQSNAFNSPNTFPAHSHVLSTLQPIEYDHLPPSEWEMSSKHQRLIHTNNKTVSPTAISATQTHILYDCETAPYNNCEVASKGSEVRLDLATTANAKLLHNAKPNTVIEKDSSNNAITAAGTEVQPKLKFDHIADMVLDALISDAAWIVAGEINGIIEELTLEFMDTI